MTDQTLVPVSVGACRCPGAPHADGDVVYLFPELGMKAGLAIMAAVDTANEDDTEHTLASIYRVMVEKGVADWTFVDDDGEKVPVNVATINGALPWLKGGNLVAKAAIQQYIGVLSPLAGNGQKPARPKRKSSRRGPTNDISTSANPDT